MGFVQVYSLVCRVVQSSLVVFLSGRARVSSPLRLDPAAHVEGTAERKRLCYCLSLLKEQNIRFSMYTLVPLVSGS